MVRDYAWIKFKTTAHTQKFLQALAVGQYSPNSQQWSILLDSSPSYYKLFTFTFTGLNFVEGDTSPFLKETLPVGSLPTVGYRTKSAQAAAGLNAPGSVKAMVVGTIATQP